MTERFDTIVIGGGQAGLAISHFLTQQGREHVVLEQSRVGESWRTQRWDSFTLVTPNWHNQLPGHPYGGENPDGFMPGSEVVGYLEGYAASFDAPVRAGVRVDNVDRESDGIYTVNSQSGSLRARNVVVATGSFQHPKRPPAATNLPSDILQLHCSEYRNPAVLPPGAVLVVGSAQSGCQIAEELYQSGRQVFLCVGSAGRVPRRYRGRDTTWWLAKLDFFDQTVDSLPSPAAKFRGNPHVSGKDGGHDLNLHQFSRDGVVLLGRLQEADGNKVHLAPDLQENLAKADAFEADVLKRIDDYIRREGPSAAPSDQRPALRDGYERELLAELDLTAAGVKTIIWTLGFGFDFSWVHLPVLDTDGYPVQRRGVTEFPGLYFLGLNWLHTRKSALLSGVGADAAHVATHLAARG